MNGYYVQGNIVVVTKSISVEAVRMLKSLGYKIKFIC